MPRTVLPHRLPAAATRVAAAVFLALAWLPSPSVFAGDDTGDGDMIALTDEVAHEVEAIRGWTFKHPVDKAVYGLQELKGFLEKKIREEYSDAEIRDTEAFLKMIGALPDTTDLRKTVTEVLMSQIGGFYDPAVKSFYLIRRGDVDYGPFVNRVFIAHELTHALDDQYVDLDSLMHAREHTEEGEFVVGSLVEGSATAVMTAYAVRAQLSGKVNPDDLMAMMESEMERSRKFLEAPPYFQTILATYTCGMQFLLRGKLSSLMGGGEDVSGKNLLAALADPPQSAEQILHPGKYWDPEARDDPVVVDDASVSAMVDGTGYRVRAVNTAGEVLVALVTRDADRPFEPMAANVPAYWTNRAATGWGGDRFYLLDGETGDAGPAGLWITLWDTPEDRDEFVEAYESRTPDAARVRVSLGDRGAAFLFGIDASERDAWTSRVREAAIAFTRSGKPWSPRD